MARPVPEIARAQWAVANAFIVYGLAKLTNGAVMRKC
jgi:hypothetical protein